MIPRPVTRQSAAQQLGLSIRTIDRMIADGTLPARKFKRAVRIDGLAFQKLITAAVKAPRVGA